ncbi:MAG TPA: arginine--tRNA ligase [Candidatus Limnocylindria bacterium]
MTSIRESLRAALAAARDRAIAAGELVVPDGRPLPPIGIERPSRTEHGDFASNAAMQLAPVVRLAPMAVAETLRAQLGSPPGVLAASVAPPGFLNLQLDPAWVAGQVATIRSAGTEFGRVQVAEPHRINVEFVSANPTGPLTVGNARGAFVGDLLSRVLEAVGHHVVREYYFNDFNAQVRNLGLSLLARHEGREPPEDGYLGEYVTDMLPDVPESLWAQAAASDADAGEVLGRWASERVRLGIEASLAALGVRFDVWTSEGSLHDEGWVPRALDELRARDDIYDQDGATWFRSSRYGDDKDRVVIRSNGQPTYFASDIGYLAEKFSRGFDELVYLWGEDHHGTVARNKAAATALGFKAENVQYLLMAWVRFVRDGQEIGMSKRAGEFISLDELLAEIGSDAARWFFGSRAAATGIDFDIELAKRQSAENPVYYVQYAHARASSILRNARALAVEADDSQAGTLLHHPAEQALIRRLLDLPDVVADAAARRETHELTRFLLEAAQLFSAFYRDCRVLSDEASERSLSAARLALTDAVRQVLANGLGLLGISAPASM